jgi:hypothetical protein
LGKQAHKARAIPLAARAPPRHICSDATEAEGNDMPSFDDRENAFESKFAHDADMQFRAEARRNKLLGLWAAGLLGKSGADADAYAMEVVMADMEKAGSEDVVAKVAKDLGAQSSTDAVRAKLAELLLEAKAQLMSEL